MFDMTEDDVIDVIKDFEPNELLKCYSMKKLMFQKELTLIKEVHQRRYSFVIIGILKILAMNLNRTLVINIMMF